MKFEQNTIESKLIGLKNKSFVFGTVSLCALQGIACAERTELWSEPASVNPVIAKGLSGAAAVVDYNAQRALMFPVEGNLELAPVALGIGRGFATAEKTSDSERLLVLCRGDVPRRKAEDQNPALYVLEGTTQPKSGPVYTFSDPLSGLVIDPQSQFAVAYPSADDISFVTNPNELVLVNIQEKPSEKNPLPITLRSFGGRPKGFVFTPELELPGGKKRLLAIHTDRDVALVDLSAPEKPEITVKLTTGAEPLTPEDLVVDDGEAGNADDARIAVRIAGDSNVIVMDLLPTPETQMSPHAFLPVPNIVYVGGTPSDIAFVRTDGGLRLAALVPSKQTLSLVDPVTGVGSDVDLGAPFEKISIVTDVVGTTDKGSDVALLWSSSNANVAFVSLGVTVGKPYKSVEKLALEQPVSQIVDLPAPNGHLKILKNADSQGFVVLNLLSRTASPLAVASPGTQIIPAPDGGRAWVSSPQASSISRLDLNTLHPKNILLNYIVGDVFDVMRRDGGRAVIALHPEGVMGLSVLDANNPSLSNSIEYLGILLGDFR